MKNRKTLEHEMSVIGFFQAHPTLVVTLAYALICFISIQYASEVMTKFSVNIFDYLVIQDFFFLFFRFNVLSGFFLDNMLSGQFIGVSIFFVLLVYFSLRSVIKKRFIWLARHFDWRLFVLFVAVYFLITIKEYLIVSSSLYYNILIENEFGSSIRLIQRDVTVLFLLLIPFYCFFTTILLISLSRLFYNIAIYRVRSFKSRCIRPFFMAIINSLFFLGLVFIYHVESVKLRNEVSLYGNISEFGYAEIIEKYNNSILSIWYDSRSPESIKQHFSSGRDVIVKIDTKNNRDYKELEGKGLKLIMATSGFVFLLDRSKKIAYSIPREYILSISYKVEGKQRGMNYLE